MGLRIKGQECSLIISGPGGIAQITDIKSFTIDFKLEKKQEGYVGQTSDQMDDIYMVTDVELELHSGVPGIFDFVSALILRAQKRTPFFTVSGNGVFNFPNGQRRKVTLPDLFFSNVPTAVSARDQYVNWKLNASCQQPSFLN